MEIVLLFNWLLLQETWNSRRSKLYNLLLIMYGEANLNTNCQFGRYAEFLDLFLRAVYTRLAKKIAPLYKLP